MALHERRVVAPRVHSLALEDRRKLVAIGPEDGRLDDDAEVLVRASIPGSDLLERDAGHRRELSLRDIDQPVAPPRVRLESSQTVEREDRGHLVEAPIEPGLDRRVVAGVAVLAEHIET